MEAISGKIGSYRYEIQETLLARVGLTNLALFALSTGALVGMQKLTTNKITPFQGSLKANLCYGALQIGLFAISHAYHSRDGTPIQVKNLKHRYSRTPRGILKSVVMTVALVSIGALGIRSIERWKGKTVSPLGLSSHQFLVCQSVASAVFSLAVFAREERFPGFENQDQGAQKEHLVRMSDNDFLDCLTLFSDIQCDTETAARLQKVKAWDLISKAESVLQNSGGLEMQLILVEQGFVEEAYCKAQIMPIDNSLLLTFILRLESEALSEVPTEQEQTFVREASEKSQTISAEYQAVVDFLEELVFKAEGLVKDGSLTQTFVDKVLQGLKTTFGASSSPYLQIKDPLLPEPFKIVEKRLVYDQIYEKIAVECAAQGKLEIAQWYAGKISNSLSRLKIQIEISDGTDMEDLSAKIYSACKANLNPASDEERRSQFSNVIYFSRTDPIHKVEECIKLFWKKGMKLVNEHDLGLIDPYWKFFEKLTTLFIEANTNTIRIERNQDGNYSLNGIAEGMDREKLEEPAQALNDIKNPHDEFRALLNLSSFSDTAVHLAEARLEEAHKEFTPQQLQNQTVLRGFPRVLVRSFCKVKARLDRNNAIQWAERFFGHALADQWYDGFDMSNLICELIVEDEGFDFDALDQKLGEYGDDKVHVKAALLKTFIHARASTNLDEAWRAYLKFKELRLEHPSPNEDLFPCFHTNRCLDNLREIVKYGMNEEIYQEVKLLLQTSDDIAPPMI